VSEALLAAWYRGAPWLWLLRPLEAVFRTLAALRRLLYRSGVLPSWRAPLPVVVVGNITLGGTGKTPVIIALVEQLQARGLRPGVVSRGYGATEGPWPYRLDANSTATRSGDEALLIFRRTGCPCVVGPDRRKAVQLLLSPGDIDIVLSDDGLQHYALQRDLEIAVLDQRRGIGNGFCLPAGPLREPASRLQQVDHVLYRGGDDPERGVSYELQALVNLHSGEQRPVEPPGPDITVHALAGIGQPQQFFDTLTARGFSVTPHVFPDHHRFGPRDFTGLERETVIMTEKDAVKCAAIAPRDTWYLRISARLPTGVSQAVMALATRLEN
jgi:tetraacyldisaccharide 4'-kinase